MIRFLLAAVSVTAMLTFNSCTNQKKEPKDYIDVSSYLKGQLKYIDSVPFAFLKVVVKEDTIFTDSQFNRLEQLYSRSW
jgi:hypothetical protein